jgi:hypothetical protein
MFWMDKSDKKSVLQQLRAIYTSQEITFSLNEKCLAKREAFLQQ